MTHFGDNESSGQNNRQLSSGKCYRCKRDVRKDRWNESNLVSFVLCMLTLQGKDDHFKYEEDKTQRC